MGFLDIPRNAQAVVSTRRFALNVVMACAGAAVALAGLRALGPIPTQITLDAQRVLAQREQCEVMFAGPSYVVSQIHPGVFDASARELGKPLHACIFGGTGLRGVELRVHLQNLLAKGWPRLSLVVIDISLGDEPRFDKVNWFHPRFIQWHTWDAMGWIYEYYSKVHWDVGSEQVVGHLKHFGANYVNLGAGLHKVALLGVWPRIQRLFGRDVELPVSDEEQDYRHDLAGFESGKKKQSETYLATVSQEKHDKSVARLRAKKWRARKRERDGAWAAQLRTMVRGYGSDAIFLHAPVWRPLLSRISAVPGETEPLVLLDFNNPADYPALYEPVNRGRTQHVSWYGGIEYTKLLAREILSRWTPPR